MVAPAPHAAAPDPFVVALRPRWLVVRFAAPHAVQSWAIVNGGRHTTDAVVWHEVRDAELGVDADPRALLAARLADEGLGHAVGLLTSRNVARFVSARAESAAAGAPVRADVVATVGLGNALRAGDPADAGARVGTINVLCRTSVGLTAEAALETLALVAEARTLALLEARVPSRRSALPATGTGTDCIAVAWPERAAAAGYAGKHTALGHVVGAAVLEAVRAGVDDWTKEMAWLGLGT